MDKSESLEKTDKTEIEHEVLFNFHISKSRLQDLKKKALEEGTTVKAILNKIIAEYLKAYGDGNPVFTLEHFLDKEFMATPATFSPFPKLEAYYNSIPATEEDKHKFKLQEHIGLFKKRFGYVP